MRMPKCICRRLNRDKQRRGGAKPDQYNALNLHSGLTNEHVPAAQYWAIFIDPNASVAVHDGK
jgi:hypothetical protein